MSRKFDNHLTGFSDWKAWEDYEEYGESEWSKKENWYNAYKDTPTKEKCDLLCEEFSGEVRVYKIEGN